MSNKMKKKLYYRIIFQTASALSTGSGENQYSDSDMIRDSAGDPFIPGSSLAGIYRTFFGEKDAEDYFGSARNDTREAESRVLVYDAKLREGEEKIPYRSVIRDCVALDEWKTGKPGSKFDFEVVEPGAWFTTYLEQNWRDGDRDIGKELARIWQDHQIYIGRKTMRGLGRIGEVSICRRSFDLDNPEELAAWIDFDMYREEDWKDAEVQETDLQETDTQKMTCVSFILCQKGGISIRRYTTRVNDGQAQPDAEQLTCILGKDGEEVPYIPGSSWAGTFRHHMERLIPGCTGEYFGTCERRSSVRFQESFLKGARPKILMRNAVDRFTAGVVETALFTEKMWYGGETVLQIAFPSDAAIGFKQALAASLVDLHTGILSVGGLTAVGRGIFAGRELSVNDKTIPMCDEGLYERILTAFQEGKTDE